MTPLRSDALAAATVLVAVALPLPALAGLITGTAGYRQRIAVPPDAVFEAVLIDAAIADAPARELGRVRRQPAGQPPFRFSIPYRDSALTPRGRYAVRATLRHGGRLLFITDTITLASSGGTSQPLSLKMVPADGGRSVSPATLGPLPASWRGDLPSTSGTTRWQVDLEADGNFQLRQIFLARPAPNRVDDIGRWRFELGSNRLELRGGREAPLLLQPLDGGAALLKLDPQGQPIRSRYHDRLRRLAVFAPIEPRLPLQGMLRYLADAASIRLCATGARLPVAKEGDFPSLELAYLQALPPGSAGQPMLVNLEGLITRRPSAEPGRPPQRTLVVERFVSVAPGQGCPRVPGLADAALPVRASLRLRGTLWKLQALQDGGVAVLSEPGGRSAELLLADDQDRVSGTGGCNRLIGGFRLAGDQLSFSQLASTQMACSPAVMAFERRYVEALSRVRRWSLEKRNLLLQDGQGRTLLLFRAPA